MKSMSQVAAAARLGVSQTYLSMLENEERPLRSSLARKMMRLYELAPTILPPPPTPAKRDAGELAEELAALGYPGFAYLRSRHRKKNPSEVLLSALANEDLEARVVEALPWLLVRYGTTLDTAWLLDQARLKNLQNRLGYVVHLARSLAERKHQKGDQLNQTLAQLEQALKESKLAREDTLCKVLRVPERVWLRQNRPPEARHWNLLTDLSLEHLHYAH